MWLNHLTLKGRFLKWSLIHDECCRICKQVVQASGPKLMSIQSKSILDDNVLTFNTWCPPQLWSSKLGLIKGTRPISSGLVVICIPQGPVQRQKQTLGETASSEHAHIYLHPFSSLFLELLIGTRTSNVQLLGYNSKDWHARDHIQVLQSYSYDDVWNWFRNKSERSHLMNNTREAFYMLGCRSEACLFLCNFILDFI